MSSSLLQPTEQTPVARDQPSAHIRSRRRVSSVVDEVDPTWQPSNQTFYFRHPLTQGNADAQLVWTSADTGWLPVAGNFNLN